MKIVNRDILEKFKKKHRDARSQIDAWSAEVSVAIWGKFLDVKKRYQSASLIPGPGNQVVFNLKGNKYRLLVIVSYKNQSVFIKRAGTHKEYDRINAEEI